MGIKDDDSQSPRTGVIEIMQVLSLLAFILAVFFYAADKVFMVPIWGAIGLALAVLPFLQAKVTRPRYAGWTGVMITPERLNTLRQVGVPVDIRAAIKSGQLVNHVYKDAKDLKMALISVVGEERIEPWLELILLHAKHGGTPPETGDMAGGPLGIVPDPPQEKRHG